MSVVLNQKTQNTYFPGNIGNLIGGILSGGGGGSGGQNRGGDFNNQSFSGNFVVFLK